MAYLPTINGVNPPNPNEGAQWSLFKIAHAIWSVINGDVGFLIRGNVGTQATQTSTAPSNAAIQTANGDVLTLASTDIAYVQNLGTNPLFVKRGTGASASSFSYELQGAGAVDDGTGGAIVIEDWIGVVSVFGTSPRFISWK